LTGAALSPAGGRACAARALGGSWGIRRQVCWRRDPWSVDFNIYIQLSNLYELIPFAMV